MRCDARLCLCSAQRCDAFAELCVAVAALSVALPLRCCATPLHSNATPLPLPSNAQLFLAGQRNALAVRSTSLPCLRDTMLCCAVAAHSYAFAMPCIARPCEAFAGHSWAFAKSCAASPLPPHRLCARCCAAARTRLALPLPLNTARCLSTPCLCFAWQFLAQPSPSTSKLRLCHARPLSA